MLPALPETFGMLFACRAPEHDKQAQHEAAHALLHQSFPVYAASHGIIAPGELRLAREKSGKPYLADCPQVQLSLSHCAGLAVCLFSAHRCGVDAEPVRALRPKVVRRAYAEAEQLALAQAEKPDELFTALWTLKEAYVKALGVGISYPLREAAFRLTPEGVQSDRPGAVFRHFSAEGFEVSACILTGV